jgi:Fuc2NAc and GlcNAc transferase
MAVLVGLGYLDGLLGVIMAYLPLVLLAIKFKAGQLEKT